MIGRAPVVVICTLAAALATGCGGSSMSTTTAAKSKPPQRSPATRGWSGMGAPLAAFARAHPKNLAGCPAACYGRSISNVEDVCCEFTTMQTTGSPFYRVDGYTQGFTNGTTIRKARAAVLALMPRDTRSTGYFIQHDSTGASCAFWNIQSGALGKWFSGRTVGDTKGVLSIELSTLDASGNPVYHASNVTSAVIGLGPVDHSINCRGAPSSAG